MFFFQTPPTIKLGIQKKLCKKFKVQETGEIENQKPVKNFDGEEIWEAY